MHQSLFRLRLTELPAGASPAPAPHLLIWDPVDISREEGPVRRQEPQEHKRHSLLPCLHPAVSHQSDAAWLRAANRQLPAHKPLCGSRSGAQGLQGHRGTTQSFPGSVDRFNLHSSSVFLQ